MREYGLFLLALGIASAWPVTSRAETLDDASIRNMYAEAETAIQYPEKTVALINKKLDDGYVLKQNTTQTIGNAPPQNSAETLNKAQVIKNTMLGYDIMKIQDVKYSIQNITYASDKKTAYVKCSATTRGTLNLPDGKGGHTMGRFVSEARCLDMMMLKEGTIKIVESDCYDNLSITK